MKTTVDPWLRAAIVETMECYERRQLTQQRIDTPRLPLPTYGGGMTYGEGEPATPLQAGSVIGALIGFTLLGAAIAYLLWAGSHGGFPWQ